jgi:hypothetical protein
MTALTRALGRGHTRKLAVGAVLFAATLAIAVGPALAAAATVFRNIPTTLPGNVTSEAFEAQGASEFGDLISLAAGDRSSANLPVTVVMSIWACETGGTTTNTGIYTPCVTALGATWDQPLTLTLYAVNLSGPTPAKGAEILHKTQTFALPYRPSKATTGPCAASDDPRWYSTVEDHCWNGLAHPVTFDLPAGVTLPDELIWGIAFNTSHFGAVPTGVNGPYDSLNVGLKTSAGQPAVGTDVELNSVFLNSAWASAYGNDGGAATATGSFRDVAGLAALNELAGFSPLACFGTCPIDLAAAPTPMPTPTPTLAPTATPTLAPTATPIESFAGATAVASASASATPVEVVAAATGTPHSATPPPTNSKGPSDGGSSGLLALLISLGFGAVGLFAVGAQRRTMRR